MAERAHPEASRTRGHWPLIVLSLLNDVFLEEDEREGDPEEEGVDGEEAAVVEQDTGPPDE